MKLIISILYCIFHFSCGHSQTVINVPQNTPTVSEAVAISQTGDTIQIAPGTYTDSVEINNKVLVIRGAPNGGTIFSPGVNEKSFIINNSKVEFAHIIFDDLSLNSPPPNFGISAEYSEVTINQCKFIDLFSPISMLWGALTVNNSVFSRIRGNSIHQNGGSFLIYNNLIHEQNGGAVTINRAHGNFFNNTLEGTSPTSNRALVVNCDSISHFFNNIIGEFGIGIHLIATDSIELEALRIYNNNIYNRTAPYWYEYNENLSLPIYSGALVPIPGTGETSLSPQFVDAINDDYQLSSSSPCIDAGIDAYPVTISTDLAGTLRIFNAVPDMGAYEFALFAGIHESINSNLNLEVSPNPTQNNISIVFSEKCSGSLEVFDQPGNCMRKMKFSNLDKVNVNLPKSSGVYFISIECNGKTLRKRVIKI